MKSIGFSLLAALSASAALAAGAAPGKTVRDGITAWQKADYASAVAIWRPLAEKGNADAAFNLGQAYRLGRGVTVDLSQAKTWLEKAARSGHVDAQTTLGLLLFDSGSRDAAMVWLKKAAESGEPRAMLVYGTALFNGDGVPRDQLMAYAYVSRAAAQGLEPAKTTLSQMDDVLPVDLRRRAVEIALQNVAEKPAPGAKVAVKAKGDAKTAPKAAPFKSSPAPASVAAAAMPPAVGGTWRIQLGAFSNRSGAETLYKKLSGSAPVAGHPPFYQAVGAVTRLQVGGFPSRAAAAAACSQLSGKGQACFPVSSK
jgi:cell division septation protein DedD